MKLNGLLELGRNLPALRALAKMLAAGERPTEPLAIYHAARPYVVATIARILDRPLMVLTARTNRARQWVDELRTWLPDEIPVHNFADPDALSYERIPWASETRQRRLEGLVGLLTWSVEQGSRGAGEQGSGGAIASQIKIRDSLSGVEASAGFSSLQKQPAKASTPEDYLNVYRAHRAPRTTQAAPIVVASARALMAATLPVREMRLALRPIRQGQVFDLNKMLATWVGLGYESAAVVDAPGQFSRRGGIVDVWPPNLRQPLRIELFGDEVDSLRSFDPSTQRTIARAEQAWIGPASEALPRLGARVAERLADLDLSPCHPPARTEYEREIEGLRAGAGFRNLEWWLPYLYSQPATLLDYLPVQGIVLVDDAAELLAAFADLEGQAQQLARDLSAAGDLPAKLTPPYFTAAALGERLARSQPVVLGSGGLGIGGLGTRESTGDHTIPLAHQRTIALPDSHTPALPHSHTPTLPPSHTPALPHSRPPALSDSFVAGPRYGGQVRTAVTELQRNLVGGDRIVMVTRQAPRLAELLAQAGHAIAPSENAITLPPPGLTVIQGVMDEGWRLEAGSWKLETGNWKLEAGNWKLEAGNWKLEAGNQQPASSDEQPATSNQLLASSNQLPASSNQLPASSNQLPVSRFWFLTDAELFGWGKPKPRRPQRTRAMSPEVFFADVKPGNYVVHIEHGIGQFKGLVRLTLDGMEREYLQVEYAQRDHLYVPVHQADRLARYVGPGEGTPSLHRLGTLEWEQVKARAKKAVAEIADELLELYAAREIVQGHAFSPDAAWQAELEASFPYVETEDQLVAIEAVKHDMEQPRPMDRLICGDVGYGKTEVALRAAFKAIMDGKQVAVLVPTTVLAQQHYTNFTRRLASFPVNVASLSRFQTAARQDRAIEDLISGKTDLVVGTHRLLSKDVAFKDLGLLIVDEEQRFGVAHKERIKQMRTEVDVLTLTATPIPRTLHMSLTGVRDLSTIETPPEERLPIKTFVGDFDESLVRQAILREMDRNGQIYFVHNRVQGIEQMAARIQKIVPEAKIAVGHGQMPERELSSVMLAFAEGEYDILVCTSIIESGLDIPNCNTIIINRADMFGLAQLYQLRGRVGRSAVRAYAYLLVDKYKTLTEDARRRLEAIQEASELGAGFRIAMEDLEIRGAGELLGARQHGHISAVGFDLYTRLLSQAVEEARAREGGERESEVRSQEAGSRRNLLEDPLAPTVQLDLNLPARIPESYVPDAALRLQLYRRLAGLTTLEAVAEIAQEFSDRFGPVPAEVENLLYVVRVKVLAVNAGIEAIGQEEGQWLIKCAGLETADRGRLQEKLNAQGVRARVARRVIWLEQRGADAWRGDLVKTLEMMRM